MTRDANLDRLATGSNCHRCSAGVDEPCRTPSGKVTAPHKARIDRAVAQYVTAKRLAEVERIAELAEPEEIVHEGDTEPSCIHCRYFTGHTSWCPNSTPAVEPVYSDAGEFLGEIRPEPQGARYWTAAEIADLRDREAAERALVEFGLSPEEAQAEVAEAAAELAADDAALTPAGILAAATGHPSGRAIRSAWTV